MLVNLLTLLNLLPLLLVSASPVTKRYTNSYIVSQRTGKCLQSTNNVGAPVVLVDCAVASQWDINPGSGSVLLSGTNLALDAGTTPGNFGRLKVWTSYPGLMQQTWYLTGDNRIAITGGNQCLDDDGTNLQTYQCTTGNTNQIFTIRQGPTPPTSTPPTPPSSTSSMPPASSSASVFTPGGGYLPIGPIYQDPPYQGRRVHPNGRNDLCVTAIGAAANNGTQVAIAYCFGNDDYRRSLQFWNVPPTGQTGPVQLFSSGTPVNYCLDAGVNPSNGGPAKLWACYSGLVQQTWTYGADGSLSLSNGQCLDVVQGSQPGNQKPFNSVRDLQTWQCYAGNTNQIYTIYNP